MASDTVKMSSKGQIVIPQDIRKLIGASEGTLFSIIGAHDAIVLKKIDVPSQEELLKELAALSREGKRRLQERGMKEQDIRKIARASRA